MGTGTISSRAWASPDDVQAAGALFSASWAGPARPFVPGTVGDLEWWTALGGPDADWASRIRIWEVDGEDVGWGWFNPTTALDWYVRPGLDETADDRVHDEILAWHAELAREAVARDKAPATDPQNRATPPSSRPGPPTARAKPPGCGAAAGRAATSR